MGFIRKELREVFGLKEAENHIVGSKVRLIPDIYEDEDDVFDETEIRSYFISEDDLENEFTIMDMGIEEAKLLETGRGNETVWSTFNELATKDQRNIIKHKIKNWDDDRIIVIMGKTVLDGYHQLIANILSGKRVKYIDLQES